MIHNKYDVIIVGGGIVGLSLASALMQKTTLRLLIVESSPATLSWDKTSFDVRVSAITPASQRFFESIEVWQNLITEGIAPYEDMHVWDGESSGEVRFASHTIGAPVLGHIIENRLMQKVLWEKTKALIYCARCVKVTPFTKGFYVTLENGHTIETSLVVGADGANSPVRDALQIPYSEREYGHNAIIANVHCEKSHDFIARQRFEHTGPLALLPMKHPHLCSIVWSQVPLEAHRLMALSDADFNRDIAWRFEKVLGKLTLASQRLHFPLICKHAKRYIKEHAALIGDAAHSVHPLAGQGLNIGLGDAADLSPAIITACHQKRDFFEHAVLRRYERAARARAIPMLGAMEGFRLLFGSKNPYVLHARSVGLRFLNRHPVIGSLFIPR